MFGQWDNRCEEFVGGLTRDQLVEVVRVRDGWGLFLGAWLVTNSYSLYREERDTMTEHPIRLWRIGPLYVTNFEHNPRGTIMVSP